MEPVRKIAVHELVVSRLRRAIHLGDYLPGDRLPSERDIADRLEVSRESVREAIRVLESEGYEVDWHTYRMGHSVCTEEIADVSGWLGERLRGPA